MNLSDSRSERCSQVTMSVFRLLSVCVKIRHIRTLKHVFMQKATESVATAAFSAVMLKHTVTNCRVCNHSTCKTCGHRPSIRRKEGRNNVVVSVIIEVSRMRTQQETQESIMKEIQILKYHFYSRAPFIFTRDFNKKVNIDLRHNLLPQAVVRFCNVAVSVLFGE